MNKVEMTDNLFKNLSAINLPQGLIQECKQYLNGNTEENGFLSKLPIFDLNQIPYQVKKQIKVEFKAIDDNSYLERYYDIMLAIGNATLFSVVSSYSDYFAATDVYDYPKYPKAKVIFLKWCAELVVNDYFEMRDFINNIYDQLIEQEEATLHEAFEISDTNPRLFIAAYLVNKKPHTNQSLIPWMEAEIEKKIGLLFNKDQTDPIVNQAIHYLKGETSDSEVALDEIAQKMSQISLEGFTQRLIIGIAAIAYKESKMMRNLLKMMIHIDYAENIEMISYEIKNDYGVKFQLIPFDLPTLMEDLQIKREVFVAWMGSKIKGEYDTVLRQEIKNNEALVYKAIQLSSELGAAYLNKLILEIKPTQENIEDMENALVDAYEAIFKDKNIPKSVYDPFLEYLRGTKKIEEIKTLLKNTMEKQSDTYYRDTHVNLFKRIKWAKKTSGIYYRSICFYCYSGHYRSLYEIINFVTDKRNIKELEAAGVGLDGILPFITADYFEDNKTYLTELIQKNPEAFIENIEHCTAPARANLLELLYPINKALYAQVLVNYVNDSSKVVRGKVVELLECDAQSRELVNALLKDKKQDARECGIHILSKWNDAASLATLKALLNTEKSGKLKNIITDILKIPAVSVSDGEINIIDFCKKGMAKRSNAVAWIDFSVLPKVRYKESEELADIDIVKYLIVSYALNNAMAMNHEAKKIAQYIQVEDTADFVYEVLNQWLDQGADTKKKWVLLLACIHGDYRVVQLLKKKIEDWAENSRGAIACEAVMALALNGGNMALMFIDNISRKFKFRQVKDAAAKAFAFAATEFGVDPEELSDKIVPDLGFNQRGEQVFDFGVRKFTVKLTATLELEVYDENDKKLKALPAPNKSDDVTLAQAAVNAYKLLKKQLKSVVDIQKIRLESTLATGRTWKLDSWKALFVQNPILQQFACSLIWGDYTDEKLLNTFRYMEDGTLNTKDEAEYIIPEGAVIGLIHPIELDSDTIEQWQGQLSDYEVNQPFEQIQRKVYVPEADEINTNRVERFAGITINGLSLAGKLTKFGWYKGSATDGGGYYDFYKENVRLGIGAELYFSGVGIGYENEEITVYELVFYKAGTVKRGSYVYDDVKDADLLKIEDLPKRIFSEIVYELDKATASKTGKVDHWVRHEVAKIAQGAEVQFNKANALDSAKDFDGAKAEYEKTLEMDPNYIKAHYNLAMLLSDEFEDFEGAKSHYETALAINPNYIRAHFNLALLLKTNFKDYAGARSHYEKTLEIKPNSIEAKVHNNLAILVLEQFGDPQGAKRHYEMALEIDPNYAYAHNNLAELLESDTFKDYESARLHYERAVELDPTDTDMPNSLAKLLATHFNENK